jgi:hypothetical protein
MVARATAKLAQLSERKILLYFNTLIREYTRHLLVVDDDGNDDGE